MILGLHSSAPLLGGPLLTYLGQEPLPQGNLPEHPSQNQYLSPSTTTAIFLHCSVNRLSIQSAATSLLVLLAGPFLFHSISLSWLSGQGEEDVHQWMARQELASSGSRRYGTEGVVLLLENVSISGDFVLPWASLEVQGRKLQRHMHYACLEVNLGDLPTAKFSCPS